MFQLWMKSAVLLTSMMTASWAFTQTRFDFNATPGFLSKDIRPSHYRLHFDVDPKSNRFSGRATISIKVEQESSNITLHADDLAATEASIASVRRGFEARALRLEENPRTQTWRLTPKDGKAIAAGQYLVTIAYTGNVNNHASGLYRAPYKVNGQSSDMLATQLEAVFARKLFPAFDEPVFRSVFEVSIEAPSHYDVYANMPAQSVRVQGEKKLHTFKPTPLMPTYLVAFTVGEFDALKGQSGRVPLRILTAPGRQAQASYAMEVTQKVLPFYKSYFGIDYALPKLDQLAVPSTRDGAMEDWGLISYAETALLFDPSKSGAHRQRQIFSTVAHEVAHQWFGNLVTAASWEEIWLNEAFATWMAEKATDHFNPEWTVSLRRRQPIDWAMIKDASSATRAIRSGSVQEDRVFDVFDEITYSKGSAVLGMIESWLGPDVFQIGLAAYMKNQQFSNATAADLWFHIGQAAGRDVSNVARSWTDQKGFPLLQVSARCEKGHTQIKIQQQRFSTDTEAIGQSIWKVPLIVSQGDKTHRLLLTKARQDFVMPGCSKLPLMVNAGGQGFYRVQYTPEMYTKLVQEFASLPPIARITLLSDSFALLQTGQLSMSGYWSLLAQLPTVRGIGRSTLLDIARENLEFLYAVYAGTPAESLFSAKARQLLAPELKALGWSAQAGESSEIQLLRNGLIGSLAHLGDETVLEQADQLFRLDQAGTQPLRPEIRDAVLYAVGKRADADRHASLLQRLLSANSEEDRWRYAKAIAAVEDTVLARQVLGLALLGLLPSNIASRLPAMVSDNSLHSAMAYQFVLEHFTEFTKLSGEMFGASSWLLPAAASSFNTEDRAKQLVADQQQRIGEKGAKAAAQIAAQIKLKAAIRQREPFPH